MQVEPLRYIRQGEPYTDDDGKTYTPILFNSEAVIEDMKTAYNVLHFINEVLLDDGSPDYGGFENIESVLETLEDLESSYMNEKYNLIIKDNFGQDLETNDEEE